MRISIHALLAESDDARHRTYQLDEISIHALLAESDAVRGVVQRSHEVFLSTLSLRRATQRIAKPFREQFISIHALLAESDCGCFARCR